MKKCETTAWHVYNFITLRIKQTILIFDRICCFFQFYLIWWLPSRDHLSKPPHINTDSGAIVTPLTSLSLQISFLTPLVSCWLPVSWLIAVDLTMFFSCSCTTNSNFRKAKGCVLPIRWIVRSFYVHFPIA